MIPRLKGWLTANALKLVLWWKSRPGLMRGLLASKDYPKPEPLKSQVVRVGVVQLRLELIGDGVSYASKMYDLVLQAAQAGAQLLVFPEETGTHLLGLLPGLEAMTRGKSLEGALAEMGGVQVADVFRAVGPAAQKIYETTFSELAKRFGVYIVAGSINLPDENGELYNVAYLFGPEGRVLGTQRKTHLLMIEEQWGFRSGDIVQVFQTPFARIAFPICMDHTYFEPARIAWLQGAEVIIDPSANYEVYNYWKQARGVWGRIQENPCYGILSSMVGDFLGFTFQGRSGVYRPLAMDPQGGSVIAEARTADREEIVVADLDMAALRRFRAGQQVSLNTGLYRKYLPALYETHRQSQREGRRSLLVE
ncbi:MAG: nitrilase [Chloroflexi bacterium]|nr:nitrilase [Chloroflexota bacterium]